MKKLLLFVVFIVVFLLNVFADDPEIDQTGFSRSTTALLDSVIANDIVFVKGKAIPGATTNIINVHSSGTTTDSITVLFYTEFPPTSASYLSEKIISISDFSYSSLDNIYTFQFKMHYSIDTSIKSFQLCFGLVANDGSITYGTRHTTYIDHNSYTHTTSPYTLDSNHKSYLRIGPAVYAQGELIDESSPLSPNESDRPFIKTSFWFTGDGTPTITSMKFDISGNSDENDFESNGFKLWYSTDDVFDALDTKIGIDQNYGIEVTFDELNEDLEHASKGKRIYFLTASTSSSASGTMDTNMNSSDNLAVTGGRVNYTCFPVIGGPGCLPVILSELLLDYFNSLPQLTWTTQSEINNAGYNIYRGTSENIYLAQKINSEIIEGQGTTSEPTTYFYTDLIALDTELSYWYWLESVDISGRVHIYNSLKLEIPGQDNPYPPAPDTSDIYGLIDNYPNPFNPITIISFKIKEESTGTLDIYNIKGQIVRTIFEGNIPSEQVISVVWNGMDNFGNEVGSGVYFTYLKTLNKTYTRTITLMK
ncbi:MAG: T9SS type A sorting domain-containing protein [Candidatus Cloacimonetes bacterium]|nr:T9SS type A sorting domain-containing protein [Candidatus Cloacimonadota bacterium]